MDFVLGQRWVSQAEPQLGLGIVVEAEGRQLVVHFPAADEDRAYARDSAPLARVAYQAGDHFQDLEHHDLTVVAVEEMNGLQYYLAVDADGKEHMVPEPKVSGQIELSSPSQRLFSGQLDRNKAYQLRIATMHFRYQWQQSAAKGLLGSRTNLLPHQVYIAHEVATRFAPRVLLADEVGLGKTIESGMILHHQLQTGRTGRALIIVPDALQHQWLVEMLRRFNLAFSLFDRERIESCRKTNDDNPFDSEQLILCSIDLLTSDEKLAEQVLDADWDMVIVDEAHHLQWRDDDRGRAYRFVESLGQKCQGLLLLTATPEQLGVESHFARLRLLDPARFSDLDAFIAEQENYTTINAIVDRLQSGDALDGAQQEQLGSFLEQAIDSNSSNTEENAAIIRQLLDRHGTGRVLFRNTRSAITDFPVRLPQGYPLEAPPEYLDNENGLTLYPEKAESLRDQWIALDPRITWLESLLAELKSKKVLLICSSAQTAVDLEKHLHLNAGIRSAAFYEGLSIVERDRAAAYFADEEAGGQVLICSEIGSEGRNFQFAHHLVLFDLPTNPDLLEQRIGRLDRIGQREDIRLHVPYISGGAQECLYRWYHEGMNSFGESFSAARAVYEHFEDRLQPFIATGGTHQGNEQQSEQFTALLADTTTHCNEVREQLQQGRDRLLELNSCDHDTATTVIEAITASEKSEVLQSYMMQLFDIFGVDHDFHSDDALVLRPTDHMLSGYFPGLREEGVTVTFSRDKAQAREDMLFLTWEHPMVSEAMEMVLGSEMGNTAIAAMKLKSIPAGTLLLETFFTPSCKAPAHLQIEQFLPEKPVRVLLSSTDKDLTSTIKHAQLNKLCEHVKKSTRPAIIKQVRPEAERLLEAAHRIARDASTAAIESARENLIANLDEELARLTDLQRLTGTVRQEEINYFSKRKQVSLDFLDNVSIDLQAIRIVINT